MEIEEYLKYTCSQLKIPRLLESENAKAILTTLTPYVLGISNTNEIEIYQTYSSFVYPRHIRLNSKDYIIWDNHFWDLYGHFLLIYFSRKHSQSTTKKPEHYINCCKSLLLLFLSSRFEKNPSFSRYLAEEYKIVPNKIFKYSDIENIDAKLTQIKCLEYLNIGRLFGYCHELAHIAFEKQNQLAQMVRNKVLEYCKDWVFCEKLSKILENNSHSLDVAYSNAKILMENSDGKIQEEICCDIIAMYAIITYFEDQDVSSDIICEQMGAIHYFFLFTWWLSSNERFWNMMRIVHLDPISNDCAFVDEDHPFFRFGEKLTEELAVRTNFSYNFVSEFSKLPCYNKPLADQLINGDFYNFLNESNCYDVMERVLQRYRVSHKDYNSGIKHLSKKNKLVGWTPK